MSFIMKIYIYFISFFAIYAISTTARAQSCDSSTLWPNIHLGMTKDEFKALYPSGKTEFIPGCSAYVNGKFYRGKLTKAMFVRYKLVPGCPSRIKDMIESECGKSVKIGRDQSTIFLPALPLFRMKTSVDIWSNQSILIALHRPLAGDVSFTIILQSKDDRTAPLGW